VGKPNVLDRKARRRRAGVRHRHRPPHRTARRRGSAARGLNPGPKTGRQADRPRGHHRDEPAGRDEEETPDERSIELTTVRSEDIYFSPDGASVYCSPACLWAARSTATPAQEARVTVGPSTPRLSIHRQAGAPVGARRRELRDPTPAGRHHQADHGRSPEARQPRTWLSKKTWRSPPKTGGRVRRRRGPIEQPQTRRASPPRSRRLAAWRSSAWEKTGRRCLPLDYHLDAANQLHLLLGVMSSIELHGGYVMSDASPSSCPTAALSRRAQRLLRIPSVSNDKTRVRRHPAAPPSGSRIACCAPLQPRRGHPNPAPGGLREWLGPPASRPCCATATTTSSRRSPSTSGPPRPSSRPSATRRSTPVALRRQRPAGHPHQRARGTPESTGACPVNLKFLIEGEEEVGSQPHPFVMKQRAFALRRGRGLGHRDVRQDVPSITYGLRA